MKAIKYLFFLKIALLPGLATIGYFVTNGGIDWMEVLESPEAESLTGPIIWGLFSGVIMLFVSVLYFFKLAEVKPPTGILPLLAATFQLPLMVFLQYYFGMDLNIWTGSMSAFLIEMNAFAIAVAGFYFFGRWDDNQAPAFLFLLPPLLLNFSVYGWPIWQNLLTSSLLVKIPFGAAIFFEVIFFIRAEMDNKAPERIGEQILGKETISGIVLVPTWGMLLLVQPLWPIIKLFF